MKKIAILGRPNVGKSSLFNRLAKERIAITSNTAGTTRDTHSTEILISNNTYLIIDTGGIEKTNDVIFSQVRINSLKAAKEANLVLYMVDGKAIPNDEDKKLIYELQKDSRVLLVVNKIDSDRENEQGFAFYEFGLEDVFFISVSHNRGISKLLNKIDSLLADNLDSSDGDIESDLIESLESSLESKLDSSVLDDSKKIRVGIIGRVNVGKSSLLNALIGNERSVVSQIAGTTIDPVNETIKIDSRLIEFVDTAGIRRRGKIEGLEKFALERTDKMLENADIAILVLDSSEPFYELDEKIFSIAQKHNLGIIVVFNKWDIKKGEFKDIKAEFLRRFRFLEYAPFLTISAKNKRHINDLKHKILEIYDNYSYRIPTSKLNESLKNAQIAHPIPSDHGKIVKIYYGTQYDICPPQIALVSNRPKSIHFSYKRFLVNRLREEFSLIGTPIILNTRSRKEEDEAQD